MLWVRKNSGSKEDAEDVVQEAIIVYLKISAKPGFHETSKPETLLFAIARNIWLYQLRQNKRMPYTDSDELLMIAGIEELDIIIEKEEQLKKIEYILNDLGEKCRQLLEMFYFRKIDMKTIAEKLEFRNDKVAKAMKYKCLAHAKELIQKQTK